MPRKEKMICIPVSADASENMLEQVHLANREPAELIELRFDSLRGSPPVEELVAAAEKPVIATCRSRREGGGHDGGEAERRDILRRAVRAGAKYIDAEESDVAYMANFKGNSILIASMHDFNGMPANLREKTARLAKTAADWVKFAVTPLKPADNIAVLGCIATCEKPCIGIGMGDVGLMTRILGLAYGSKVTFGSLERGRESAPGQPTARELKEIYRVHRITRATEVYGLLGCPVAQSRGYILHNRSFAECGIDAVYIPFLTENAEAFLSLIPDVLNLRGLSVTIPHKPAALSWAETSSEAARRIGAANTLTLLEGGWHADNTDCGAMFECVKAATDRNGINLTGAEALVLGAGGTTRAAGVALMLLGCRVTLAARNSDKAQRLGWQMDWDVEEWEDAPRSRWDAVVNTTPVGMVPNAGDTPFPAGSWRKGMIAFDVVAQPPETRFLREAAAAGAVCIRGEELFLRQAAGQFRMWTGEDLRGVDLPKRIAAPSSRRYRQL